MTVFLLAYVDQFLLSSYIKYINDIPDHYKYGFQKRKMQCNRMHNARDSLYMRLKIPER